MEMILGEGNHGATKSLYGRDHYGNEFEIMWLVPRDNWCDHERSVEIDPLQLGRELSRYCEGKRSS